MSRINLLPWREARRTQLKVEFFSMVGIVVVLACLIWAMVHFYYAQLIDFQNERIAYIDSEIAVLDKKIEEIKELEKQKAALLARMNAIKQLQGNRPLIVHLFDEVVRSMPDGVSVTSISQAGNQISISGVAESNARVSSLMRNLENSQWLSNPSLKIIESNDVDEHNLSSFKLAFSQVLPSQDEDDIDKAVQ